MRRSASEIIRKLELRVARLEKQAIFRLFKDKDKDEGLSLKEQDKKRIEKKYPSLHEEELREIMDYLKAELEGFNPKFNLKVRDGVLTSTITVEGLKFEVESKKDKLHYNKRIRSWCGPSGMIIVTGPDKTIKPLELPYRRYTCYEGSETSKRDSAKYIFNYIKNRVLRKRSYGV
jgi:hypothetical protein